MIGGKDPGVSLTRSGSDGGMLYTVTVQPLLLRAELPTLPKLATILMPYKATTRNCKIRHLPCESTCGGHSEATQPKLKAGGMRVTFGLK